MKEIAKILGYFIAVIFLGALLAPPLYWAGQWLARLGVFEFLSETEFQKFFNRAMLISAVVLLWPAIRWLAVGRWHDLGLQHDRQWLSHLGVGFGIAAVLVASMAASYVALDIYRWKAVLPWGALPKLAFSAFCVALLEEALFRGAIFGLFRRTLGPYTALFWTTAIFAILHFLKPDDDIHVSTIGWLSGFQLVPYVFHQFSEPMMLLAGFTTLFVLGWMLGYSTLRTRSLWMAIGLHAGVVFVKMSFSKFTKRADAHLPWVGEELQIGFVPVLVLLFGMFLVWLWLRYEYRRDQRTVL
ncbi:CPBP family intramembrane glutamic endopeptidase [Verrucomicrobiota bacterium sgz303538]